MRKNTFRKVERTEKRKKNEQEENNKETNFL